MQTNELYIGNLDQNVKPEELKEIFQAYGTIKRCEVKVGDRTHTASYGFIAFESVKDAEFAKEQINGLNLRGRRMIVQYTKTKPGRNQRRDRFIGLDHSENQNKNNSRSRSRSRSRDRYRRRSPSYDRRSRRDQNSRDDRRRKHDRSHSSSNHKSSSKRFRTSSNDDKHRTSYSSQNGNSKRH